MTYGEMQLLLDNYGKAVRAACVHHSLRPGEFTELLEEVARCRRTLDNAIKELLTRRAA